MPGQILFDFSALSVIQLYVYFTVFALAYIKLLLVLVMVMVVVGVLFCLALLWGRGSEVVFLGGWYWDRLGLVLGRPV